MKQKSQQFASDNYSGMCPEALEYFLKCNTNHVYSYGDDPWTDEASDLFREIFERDCEVFFVFNGTAANSLALSALCQSYHSIITNELAHVETDECGATEFFSNGAKILLSKGEDGKLTPAGIEELVLKRTDIHYPKPKVVSVTQATEVGTVYSIKELQAIQAMAEKHKLKIHMDGARFANAVASLDVSPREITWETGVDVLCFGGIKNGLAVGEAVVFFNLEAAEEFDYRCKQSGQLASKMRFLSAPWLGLLKDNVWLKNARHANRCAQLLAEEFSKIDEINLMFPRQANSVFVLMPVKLKSYLLQKGWHFYTFIGLGGARFMTSWDTTEETIHELIKDVKEGLRKV
ncbi:MAG: threonine aldolase family protein [Bacteroidota bacterium]